MATNFPTSVDILTNPVSNDSLNSPSHSAQHANANDAIEAIENAIISPATYPNQLVNGTTATVRPLPFALEAGSASATYPTATTVSASVTFTANRFTQAPLVIATVSSVTPASLLSVVKTTSITTSGFTLRWDNPATQTGSVSAAYQAIQMTSAAAAG